jgi:hypothetical protein
MTSVDLPHKEALTDPESSAITTRDERHEAEKTRSADIVVDEVAGHECIVCRETFATVRLLEDHVMGCARRAAALASATPEPGDRRDEADGEPRPSLTPPSATRKDGAVFPPSVTEAEAEEADDRAPTSSAPSCHLAAVPSGGGGTDDVHPLPLRTDTPPSEPEMTLRSGSADGSPSSKAVRRSQRVQATASSAAATPASTLHDVLQSLEEMQQANKERMARAAGSSASGHQSSLDASRESIGRPRAAGHASPGEDLRSQSVSFAPAGGAAQLHSCRPSGQPAGSPLRSTSVGPPQRGASATAPAAPVLQRRGQLSAAPAQQREGARPGGRTGMSSPPPRRSLEEVPQARRTATVHASSPSASSPSASKRPLPRTSSVGAATARSRNAAAPTTPPASAKPVRSFAGQQRPASALSKPLVASNGLQALHRAALPHSRPLHDSLAAVALRRGIAAGGNNGGMSSADRPSRHLLVPPPPLTAIAATAGRRAGTSPDPAHILVRSMTTSAAPSSTTINATSAGVSNAGVRLLYCTECGRRHLAETAKFCAFCGHRREKPAAALF